MSKIKKAVSFLIASFMLSATATYGQTVSSSIDRSKLDDGLVSINYDSQDSSLLKVMISKDSAKYTYNLASNNTFPLQLGDGVYNVSILENVEGNQYRIMEQEKVDLKLDKQNEVFLQSIQMINWDNSSSAVQKAAELTRNAKTDKEKVTAIYNYIISHISYDNDKASYLDASYIPCIDDTFNNSKGICYDYSVLFAAMLRSVGVPAKLVMGHKDDIKVYHAWNQVYLKDTGEWLTIDTTYDAGLKKAGLPAVMVKSEKEYTVNKVY